MRLWLLVLCWTTLLAAPALANPLASFGPDKLKAAEGPCRTLILTIDKPAVKGAHYALRGQVAYEGVEQDGYLELLSYFPGDQMYFTRGLATTGPMGVLRGTSKGRAFELPFDATGPDGKILRPTRLELNVVLPKGGKVRITSVDLVEIEESAGWVDQRQAGLLGGLAGTIVGLLGGLLGWLVQRGRARAFVLVLAKSLSVSGLSLLVLALFALLTSQPFHVVFPLLLLGVVMTGVFAGSLPELYRRYTELELRRMRVMDTVG